MIPPPRYRARARHTLAYALLALSLVGMAGCGDTVISPIAPSDYYFSVYGYVDTAADSHFVRIVPIRRRLERPDQPAEIDAVVTLRALDTGTEHEWHALHRPLPGGGKGLRLDDGSYGHVFVGTQKIWPGVTYELEVRRSDGQATRARTTVPTAPSPQILPIRIVSADSITQEVAWDELPRSPFEVTIIYRVVSDLFTRTSGKPISFTLPLTGTITPHGDGWRVVVDLKKGARQLRTAVLENLSLLSHASTVEDPATFPLQLIDLTLRAAVLDDQWIIAEGADQIGLLAQPGAHGNVEQGFGFFGSIARFEVDWALDDSVRLAIGL